jgi:rubrerythrin
MTNIFNVAEVVDMGIEKEKKRRDFYALTAEQFEDEKIKDLFTKLRDWEEEHISRFTEIRSALKQKEISETYSGELESYMNVLIDDKLYKAITPEAFSKEIASPKEAIERGMEFEKDAILFFSELLNHVKDGNKETIQKLIDEEKQHLLYLFQLKSEYE